MEDYKNLLFINGKDVFAEYGAYLAEKKESEHKNYDSLMKPSAAKANVPVDYREENGERHPDDLAPAFEARDVELRFAIIAPDTNSFLDQYFDFIRALKMGDKGWLLFRFPELNNLTFKMFYKDSTEWEQLTFFEDGMVAAYVRVKFREPNPTF